MEHEFSMKELYDVFLKTTYPIEIGKRIIEEGEVVFEIKTFAYSREQAQNIVHNWKNNAKTLYPELLATLTKKDDKK